MGFECLHRGREPTLQNAKGIGRDFAKPQPHAQMGVGINHCRRSLKRFRFIDDLDAHWCPVGQGINSIHVAAGGADIADARSELRAHALGMDLGGRDEWESG